MASSNVEKLNNIKKEDIMSMDKEEFFKFCDAYTDQEIQDASPMLKQIIGERANMIMEEAMDALSNTTMDEWNELIEAVEKNEKDFSEAEEVNSTS